MLSPYSKGGFLRKFTTALLTVEHRVHTTIGRGKQRFPYAQLYSVLKPHVKCVNMTISPLPVAVLRTMPLEPKMSVGVNVTVYSVSFAFFGLCLDGASYILGDVVSRVYQSSPGAKPYICSETANSRGFGSPVCCQLR